MAAASPIKMALAGAKGRGGWAVMTPIIPTPKTS
jgi:hypothetical protein